MSVFIIIDAWVSKDGTEGQEVVAARYFQSEDEAHDHLVDIAESFGETLAPDDTNFTMENHTATVEWEEYYIQELTR